MAFILNPSNKTSFFHEEESEKEISIYSIMVENASDLTDIPSSIGVGSLAYTAGFKKLWQKDFDGSWVEVVLE